MWANDGDECRERVGRRKEVKGGGWGSSKVIELRVGGSSRVIELRGGGPPRA